jgi:hypothetical protein
MEEQLLQQTKASNYYSLQIDESTGVTNMAIPLVYVQCDTPVMWGKRCYVPLNVPQILEECQHFKPLIITLLNMVWTGNVVLYSQTEQQL